MHEFCPILFFTFHNGVVGAAVKEYAHGASAIHLVSLTAVTGKWNRKSVGHFAYDD